VLEEALPRGGAQVGLAHLQRQHQGREGQEHVVDRGLLAPAAARVGEQHAYEDQGKGHYQQADELATWERHRGCVFVGFLIEDYILIDDQTTITTVSMHINWP
jgi:hypothetical protein